MAKNQAGGLGRGIDALFGSSEVISSQRIAADKVATEKAAEEKAATERAAAEKQAAERLAAERIAEAEAARIAKEAAARKTVSTDIQTENNRQNSASEIIEGKHQVQTEQGQSSSEDETGKSSVDASAMADIIDAGNLTAEFQVTARAPRKTASQKVEKPDPQSVEQALPQEMPLQVIPDGSIAQIALEYIEPNPFQPRLRFKEDELNELAASIAKDGLIQPITVRPMPDGHFQVVAGERRLRASRIAGIQTIPAYILMATDGEMAEYALVENLQREDLNPIEAAIGYRNMMLQQNLTQSELATILCKGRSTIANTLRLLDLPEDLQEMIYNEQLTEGHARAIQGVPTPEGRKKLADKVVAEGLSVRATEQIARLMAGRGGDEQQDDSQQPKVPAAWKNIARSLKKRLGTNVKVKNSGGKNRLEIEFTDADDLERICKELLGSAEVAE